MTTRLIHRSLIVCLFLTSALFALPCAYAQNNGGGGNGGGNGGGGNGGGSTPGIGNGIFISNRAVGGVSIDANGMLQNIEVDQHARLDDQRLRAMVDLPGDLNQAAPMRKVSLRRLEQAVQQHLRDGSPLADEILFLAGLQEIKYIFVYPDQNDIVLAGFGEGWRFDQQGNVVGVTTGRPVLLLDDLLVALRTADGAARTGISCSIDPTQEGLNRLQSFLRQHGGAMGNNPQGTISGIEESLGPQVISVTGVPATSHFAQVLVAADYRMKRLAMNFEPSPVRGMVSYLQMSNGKGSMMPRWWLEPDYDPLLKDASGLAFEVRGTRVKAVTEVDFLAASGQRQRSGQASPIAQRWADNMTKHYDELATRMPIFAELRNVMTLSVVAALIAKENLADKAGCPLPVLLNPSAVQVAQLAAPRQVPSQASFMKRGSNWIISASGGVLINSWALAAESQTDDSGQLAPLRDGVKVENAKRWWWN